MFQFLNSIGTWLSSACALGFAAFWGWSSVFLSPKATADTRLSSEAGVLLVVGLVLAIAFVGFHAVVTMVRKGKLAAAPAPQRAETAAAPSDFDAEAIIARHIANKARAPQIVTTRRARPASAFLTATPARSFGRKVA